MTKRELRKKLNALNIDKFAYDLNGGLPNETYCIQHNTAHLLIENVEKQIKFYETAKKYCPFKEDSIFLLCRFSANQNGSKHFVNGCGKRLWSAFLSFVNLL